MSTIISPRGKPAVIYPESDGLPMSDNTKQFRWIVTIQGGIDAVYRDEDMVFVAGNLLWYPVEGDNVIRSAPDIFVVFGRPKGDRGSYLQWKEDNIAPQVTFEVLSPGNRAGDLIAKFQFYDRYGVEEYYLWDPDHGDLRGWLRDSDNLRLIPQMNGWTSPRLGIRFEVINSDLRLYAPDGTPFATYVELAAQREEATKQSEELSKRHEELSIQHEELGIQHEELSIQLEELSIQHEELTKQREQERQAKDQAQESARRFADQLRALGIDPEA